MCQCDNPFEPRMAEVPANYCMFQFSSGVICTRERGHLKYHAAHDANGKVLEVCTPSYDEYITQTKSQSIDKATSEINQMNKTMTRRFYKTNSPIQAECILKLYTEAVEDAKSAIRSGKNDKYYIVEVVAEVERVYNPDVTVSLIRK